MKTFFLFSIFCITSVVPAFSQCLDDQKSLLLGLKNSLIFNFSASRKLVLWNQTKDCCSWEGIECDVFGHVTSLQLDEETISGGIENSKYIFNLSYLEKLNLAGNHFDGIQIPEGLSNLANLTHLNLSYAGFGGQVSSEVLRLKKLVSLDFSALFPLKALKLENPDLKMLVQNLKGLKELYLDSIDLSAQGNDWCQVFSSSLPDLRTLSLRNCSLSGPIDYSLLELQSLSILRLDLNNLAYEVPHFLANFSRLTTLSLYSSSLLGSFPEKIFKMPSLQNLDLSFNPQLSGTFPNFPQHGSLRTIVLSSTNFSGLLPDSITNLTMLSSLDLSNSGFFGPIPPTIGNLTELRYLDASYNSLMGSLSSIHFVGFLNLEYIDLRDNLLSGNIPSSLFAVPSLRVLDLSNNEFHGQVQDLPNLSSSSLEILDVSSNHLEGPIPRFFYKLDRLTELSVSSNNFKGTLQLTMFRNQNLSRLELSHNDLFIQSSDIESSLPLFPNIQVLNLASCKLQRFPSLHRESRLLELDLSSNQLKGEIPNWIWEIGNGSLRRLDLSTNLLQGFQKPYRFRSLPRQSRFPRLDLSSNQLKGEIPNWIWEFGNSSHSYLNLSNNLLHGFQKPYRFPSLGILDLHSNELQGKLPLPPFSSRYVDYSYNHFTNSIPNDIGVVLHYATFFSASNNNLTGEIPPSICNATWLAILDLSTNALTGGIPLCLPNNSLLRVLSLGRNNLSGTIPDTFSVNCPLKTLDLNKNVLEGKIPRSLVNCVSLEVLNIGHNKFEDTFPCMLMKTQLHVLILRSNEFYGDLQCPKATQEWSNLQIIDISTNNFNGDIALLSFSKLKGMIIVNHNEQLQYNHLHVDFAVNNGYYYQDTVTLTMKGLEIELMKILIIFTSIDFSNNRFYGEIPYSIGDLKSLYGLNLSHNEITGSIPASIGNLTQLESLDLSINKLSGKIPGELASLNFIGFLNLSYNRLFGKIPEGSQLQTFSADSYEGNPGLYGCPIDASCNMKGRGSSTQGFQNGEVYSKKEIDWDYVSVALGFAVGFGGTVWLLLHYERWKEMYFGKVDQILLKLVRMF